ncbi:TniB family NTP-binding protein [Rhizobium laguerreae]|uniref:TniB family NTP-binding protein n=1 Tax=Rhizobium laguerreae TaxID=1076926 RepID=UPI001C91DA52|nr:TniB family NTP-binding protein [Rhizobium laguerreae]MBY3559770.1 AAA family ATPase [Rhizobium laguerreae]
MNNETDIAVEFRHMRIGYPALFEIHERFDSLRQSRRTAMADTRGTNTEASCISMFWPSHAGKTTVIDWYVESRFPGQRSDVWPEMVDRELRVVVITLDSGTNFDSFGKQCLKAFGCPLYAKNERNPWVMFDRLHKYIAGRRTELIIFDETNNLRMRKASDTDATNIHNALRAIAKKQGCPIVVVGTEEAKERIFSDTQIANIGVQLPFERLRLTDPLFIHYCAAIGIKLVEHGLFSSRSNFVQGYCLSCLHEVSGGLRGRVSRLVQHAADIARSKGAERVELRHLELATDLYAIPNGFISFNPFTKARKIDEESRRRALVERSIAKALATAAARIRPGSSYNPAIGHTMR